MNVGDILLHTKIMNLLCVCTFVDRQNGTYHVRQITDAQGTIFDEKTNVGWEAPFSSKNLSICSSADFQHIIKGRPLPHWVHLITATINTPGVAPLPAMQTGYPIGSLIIGSGKAGNVWIVNKQNSRDISLLWDGKNKRWCGSELERPDNLLPKPHHVSARAEVIVHVHQNKPLGFGAVIFPAWADKLILTTAQAPLVKPPVPQGMSPAVVGALTKANILAPLSEGLTKKKVDSIRDTCDHEFKSYIGIREVYDYCTKCDFKVGTKQ